LTFAGTRIILSGMETGRWPLHELTLKALNLSSLTAFYEEFGFLLAAGIADRAVLTAGEGCRLTLRQLAHGRPRPSKTAGLFHFALLLPERTSLGAFVRFAARKSFRFLGAADHLVSESLYFLDPEGNGIEVYADRARDLWEWEGSAVKMATNPLDLEELARLPGPPWCGFPPGTRLGHMHLTVGELDRSLEFYKALGLELTLDWGTFQFLSWDGYHHHLALNLAEGRHAALVAPEFAGLESFSIERDSLPLEVLDPNGIRLVLPSS
jgi:catechol 2,3-dioxygenase